MNKTKSNRFFPEVRERAVRLVLDRRGEYPPLWAAIESIAPKIGRVPQTLHEWVRKHEIDTGQRDGLTRDERERIKALEREVKESASTLNASTGATGMCARGGSKRLWWIARLPAGIVPLCRAQPDTRWYGRAN